jgi:transglutaminase-like putative cysteine protease
MLYDVRLAIRYDYDVAVTGGRHALRVMPRAMPGGQSLVAGSLDVLPEPAERADLTDFYGNPMTLVAYRTRHDSLELTMKARVSVEPETDLLDLACAHADLAAEMGQVASLVPASPHHFRAPSPRIPSDGIIAGWVRESVAPDRTVRAIAAEVASRIHADFAYDPEATEVDTTPRAAFDLKRGVCQDFAHVMIGGLRAAGIPAAYVSGYLRTEPPPGRPRLEGADAMHAWVRVWCGQEAGWVGFDPTNAIETGADHITVAIGRDYADVAPVIGVLRASGGHRTALAVDVVPVGAP